MRRERQLHSRASAPALRAAVTTVMLAGLVVAPATPAGGTHCDRAPVMRDVAITQGLATARPLVRNKEMLVRVYLTKSACDTDPGSVVELTTATVSVSREGTPVYTAPSTPSIQSPFPTVGPFVGGLTADGAGNVTFVIPGAILDNPAAPPTSPFGITVSLTVGYQATGGEGPTGGTVSTSRQESVSRQTNAVRIYVVPMGDGSKPYAAQLPDAARTVLQNSLQSLARQLPVPDGVGDFDSIGTGVKYEVAPTMLDLAAMGLMPGGKFCGGAGNFPTVSGQLANIRKAYNSANQFDPADRVLGVIWQDQANGLALGCAEGWASFGTPEGWARLVADGGNASAPSISGAVVPMEVVHTFGVVRSGTATFDGGGHSVNVQADTTAPDRGFNVPLRQFLATDKATMRLSGQPWHGINTLLEPQDWSDAWCTLTPGNLTGCRNPSSIGTAPAGPAFVISGTTDGTVAGTDAHSYFGASDIDGQDSASQYRVFQYQGPATTPMDSAGTGIAVSFDGSDHAHTPNGTSHTTRGTFEAAVPVISGATRLELWKGAPGNGVKLYSRTSNQPPSFVDEPVQTPVAGAITNLTGPSPARVDGDGAISPDGDWLAWSAGGQVLVQRRDRTGTAVSVPGSIPAWSTRGNKLAYIQDGALRVASVTTSGPNASIGAPSTLYDPLAQIETLAAPASSPSWSPGDSEIAFSANGDIWVVDTDASPSLGNPIVCELDALPANPCQPIVTGPTPDSAPSWSSGPHIAFERGAALYTVRRDATGQNDEDISPLNIDGAAPSFGGGLLAWSTAGGIRAARWSVAGAAISLGPQAQLTTGAFDGSPGVSATGGAVVFDRTAGGDADVYAVAVQIGLTWTLSDPDSPLSQLRSDLFLDCGDEGIDVIASAITGTTTGNVATYVTNYDPSLACSDGVLIVRASDGYATAEANAGSIGTTVTDPTPAIYGPAPGTVFTVFEVIPIVGGVLDDESGTDATMQWFLHGPLEDPDSAPEAAGTGPRPPHLEPPLGGWTPGTYRLILRVTDPEGNASETYVEFRVVRDDDGDHQPGEVESCLGPDADQNPANAYGDSDGDLIVNVDDPEPCSSANNAVADFDPNTLYVPSAGNSIVIYITGAPVGLTALDPKSVGIENIDGTPVWIAAETYSVSKGKGVAKFNRLQLTSYLHQQGFVGRYVPMAVGATSNAGVKVRAVDPSAPVTAPAT